MIDLDPQAGQELATVILAGLTSSLEHEDVAARRIAVQNLGRMGAFALPAVAGLAKCLMRDPDYGIREDAAYSLAMIGRETTPWLVAALAGDETTMAFAHAFLECGLGIPKEQVVGVLIENLDSQHVFVRAKAAATLADVWCGKIPAITNWDSSSDFDSSLVAIQKCLADEDSLVRIVAAKTLWDVWLDRSGVTSLLEVLQRPNDPYQELASDVLTLLGHPKPQQLQSS
jgi:HEAT repeat protein